MHEIEFISTEAGLREVYNTASGRALEKELHRLDKHARNFIANSPFMFVASQDRDGNADLSPKGDNPGFVSVLDDNTIAIPDRPGNNRLDTLENVLANPAVGLLFVIPGMNETLRVNGKARITADETLCEKFAVDGRPAVSVMVVQVESAYMHCAKAFMRSKLWQNESWPPRDCMPTLGQILKDQMADGADAAETDRELELAYAKTMW
ncbi:MAG: pyridoxamine 5'-phosphate oxidase family protein [Leisingera sp.]